MHTMATVATAAALMLAGAPARAELVWTLTEGEGLAFLAVVDAAEQSEPEVHHPFYMVCSSSDGETTVVSDIDPATLGEAIAAGEVPSYRYIIDGVENDDTWQVADIRFGQMEGLWEYVSYGTPALLLEGAQSVRIDGTGIVMDLPSEGLAEKIATFGTACEKIAAAASSAPQ